MTLNKYIIIGDIHGCLDEVFNLVQPFMKEVFEQKRKIILVGDMCDRGPKSIEVFNWVKQLENEGALDFAVGNHDEKFARYLRGNDVKMNHGLEETIRLWKEKILNFGYLKSWIIDRFLHRQKYIVLDKGKLVVAHAGIKDHMIGRHDKAVEAMCLYGDVDNNSPRDERGCRIRRDWWSSRVVKEKYPFIVHGHIYVKEPTIINKVINVDTGVCYGNKLTGLLYPEMQFVYTPALKTYCEY